MNICGCLVLAMPERTAEVAAAISRVEGCEVHGHENGRVVVTVEDTADSQASEQIMALHQIPGVITLTLTYHHFEELDEAPTATPTT